MDNRNRMLGTPLLLAAAILLCPMQAKADTVAVYTFPFITSPTNFNGFEAFEGIYDFTSIHLARYSEGGISVTFINTTPGQIGTGGITPVGTYPYWGGMGQYQWYNTWNGYTTIRLTSGGNFQSLQFLVSDGVRNTTSDFLEYQILEHGSLITAGTLAIDAACCFSLGIGSFGSWATVGFSGGGFDEVRLQDSPFIASFDASRMSQTALDNISAVPEVPLPAALPLFATGLAGLGLLGWRRKKTAAAG